VPPPIMPMLTCFIEVRAGSKDARPSGDNVCLAKLPRLLNRCASGPFGGRKSGDFEKGRIWNSGNQERSAEYLTGETAARQSHNQQAGARGRD
ncbi:MAG TPA: hypothetical protein VK178_17885, partial [Opitutaceae bacterium]|nr:hypothetical protein [Opitutaceae bacterium]